MPAARLPSACEAHGTPPLRRRDLTGIERVLRAYFAAILVLVAIGTAAGTGAWLLARRTPDWWNAPDSGDPTLAARAESIERFVSNELTKPRDGASPWRIAIPEGAATAWVNARLPRWLESRDVDWPLGRAPTLVLFRDGEILLGADIAEPGEPSPRIIGARLALHTTDEGMGARISSLSFGSLSLPPSLASSSVRRALPAGAGSDTRAALETLLRGGSVTNDAAWRIDDSRVVRLVGIEFGDGRAVLTCLTEPADR